MWYSTERLKKHCHQRTERNKAFHVVKSDPYERNDKKSKEKWLKVIEEVETAAVKRQKDEEIPKEIFEKIDERRKGTLIQMLNIKYDLSALRDQESPSGETIFGVRETAEQQFYKAEPVIILKHKRELNKEKRNLSSSQSSSTLKSVQTNNPLFHPLKTSSFISSTSSESTQKDLFSEISSEDLNIEEEEEEADDDNQPWDLIVNLEDNSYNCKEKMKIDAQNCALLQRFFCSPESEAAVWRERTLSFNDLTDIPLTTKVQMIEDSVAANFMNWFNGLGGIETGINAQVLKEFFQIGMVNPTSCSFKNHLKEFGVLSERLADANDASYKSLRSVLKKHILWNGATRKMEKRTVAFNKFLPSHLQVLPPDKFSAEEWLHLSSISPDIETFSLAFSKILHYHSLHQFCTWLKRKGYNLPPYLRYKKTFGEVFAVQYRKLMAKNLIHEMHLHQSQPTSVLNGGSDITDEIDSYSVGQTTPHPSVVYEQRTSGSSYF